MTRFLVYGILTAVLSSTAVGVYLHYFYAMGFDESFKVMPIWRVISIYCSIALVSGFVVYWVNKKFQFKGVLMLNVLVVLVSIASIGLPITYANSEIDTTFLPVAAIPAHFILPLVWLGLQPFLFISKKTQI